MRSEGDGEGPYLVVKATIPIEVVEECRIGLAAPEVHIGNLKIAPNCVLIVSFLGVFRNYKVTQTHSDRGCNWHRHYQIGSSSRYWVRGIRDVRL